MTEIDTPMTSGRVTSRDGTPIGYLKTGRGPAVVILHGSMESARSHTLLAQALAGDFTVYLPDRRGRGMSGPHRPDHSVRTEVEDLQAVLAESGAQLVFGVSAGGLVVLEAARTLPGIRKIAVYEPALAMDATRNTAWLERFDHEMASGKVAAAMITSMYGRQARDRRPGRSRGPFLLRYQHPSGVTVKFRSTAVGAAATACFGEKGVARFQRDALGQPGVRTVIFLEGANDIWDSEGNFGDCGQTPRVTAGQLIAGYQTLIAAAHARGVRIIGATIIPFKAPYMSPAGFLRAEAVRDQVNHWIRTSGEFDAVADFAQAVADPADPTELNPAYNSGDFLHPNDAGYRKIAASINLNGL